MIDRNEHDIGTKAILNRDVITTNGTTIPAGTRVVLGTSQNFSKKGQAGYYAQYYPYPIGSRFAYAWEQHSIAGYPALVYIGWLDPIKVHSSVS